MADEPAAKRIKLDEPAAKRVKLDEPAGQQAGGSKEAPALENAVAATNGPKDEPKNANKSKSEGSPTAPTSAPLEQYILEAESYILANDLKRSNIFKDSSASYTPTLEKNQCRRVIIFAGCFNPPHRGHLEMLCHAFLRTDHHTIAVLIVPTDTCGSKKHQSTKDLTVALTKPHRIQLWEDEILGRFSWLWPGSKRDVRKLMNIASQIAESDGFHLEFTSLYGMDHNMLEGDEGWRDKGIITSDITRPANFLARTTNNLGKPPRIKGWRDWARTGSAPEEFMTSGFGHDPPRACWICWKVKNVFPEYFEDDFEENSTRLAGFARTIISRCHEGKDVIWTTKSRYDRWIWFLASGRKYPEDPSRVAISSTQIRRLLGTCEKEKLFDEIKDKALNPELLLELLGLK